MSASFLELYNENILDLLDPSPVKNRLDPKNTKLQIREDTQGISVTGLKIHSVSIDFNIAIQTVSDSFIQIRINCFFLVDRCTRMKTL
jgi:hypothetical protein